MNMNADLKKIALLEYFEECKEVLERLSINLGRVEKKSEDKDTLAAIYRDMHTIKGTSQLFGFNSIGSLAHIMETCLDPVRKGLMLINSQLIDAIYSGIDYISILLKDISQGNPETKKSLPLEKLYSKFVSITEFSLTKITPVHNDKIIPIEKNFVNIVKSKEVKIIMSAEDATSSEEAHFGVFETPASEEAHFGFFDTAPSEEAHFGVFETPASCEIKYQIVPDKQSQVVQDNSVVCEEQKENSQLETIRVQVPILDKLINLVGELVLIRNQVLEYTKTKEEETNFLNLSQRLNILTAELQNEVMKTRMQQIGNIFNTFTRVVRDLSKELGKKVEINLFGVDTELDKTVIESVKDPLMHLVRNCVDHGIETIEERKKLGKKEVGIIEIKAFHESGQVNIEVSDDGRGLDREKIGNKAIEKAIISQEKLEKMTDKEVQLLIFKPDFSTASSVSNISGRGVGMDVVKTNLEKIGGIVDIQSKVGVGTTIKMKIPLSLAIVSALIVRSNGQRFAIPQSKLVELIRLENLNNSTSEKIELLQGKPVLRLRGKILPIISLSEILHGSHKDFEKIFNSNSEDNIINIVILNADGKLFGLIVEEIDDSIDIVVKALSRFLKHIKVFSGATIMGDGAVALTIDVTGLGELAGLHYELTDLNGSKISNEHKLLSNLNYKSENCDVLLVDVGALESYAIPLVVVSRIEEFDEACFEYSGEQKVIRYRDYLLPVFSLPQYLHLSFEPKKHEINIKTPIVVIKRGDNLYGVEVLEIKDIIETPSHIDQSVRDRAGILGNLIVKDKIIVVIDVLGIIDELKSKLNIENIKENTDVFNAKVSKKLENKNKYKILIVEDSPFFRNYIKQVLEEDGYAVDVACDGAEGFSKVENAIGQNYSLILSDIEMPIMDGYEFARKLKSSSEFKNIPLFAITTRFNSSDIEEGKLAGFNKYLEKLNAEKLIIDIEDTFLNNHEEVKYGSSV